MDLLKLLTYEEKIGGISIFDSKIEMLFLNFDPKKGVLSVDASSFVDLPQGVVVGGVLKNEEAFIAALKDLFSKITRWGKSKTKVSSFIISLPANFVYSHNFSFPANLSDAQLDEAMKLNLKFSLPMPEEAVYVDWEPIESKDVVKKEILLCAGIRGEIDRYLSAFLKIGITAVAVEFHGISISRVVALNLKDPFLTATFSNNNLELVIIEAGAIRFLQSFNIGEILNIDAGKTEKDIIVDKIWRAINFYDSERGQRGFLKKIYLVGDNDKINSYKDLINQGIAGAETEISQILPVFPQIPLAKNSNLSHITFGAALRGLMPRDEDVIISLMPIGTEEAYERKRRVSFARIASDMISVLSVFFAILFFGSWLLMTILLGNIERSLQRQVNLPEGLIELKERAVNFNEIVGKMDALKQKTPKWSGLVERLGIIGTSGITLTRIDIGSLEGLNISGIALTRDNLLQFKIVLENSGLFTEVKIPFNYLEQKDNIAFSLGLRFKDTNLFFK